MPNAKWSVVSQSSQRHWIENDTTYAKKIVMPDNAIRPLLYERKWGTKGGPTLGSPREQWLNALAPLGLDRVLFAKRRGPAVRAWIEGRNITPDATEGVDTGSSAEHSNEAQMIGEIEWREFREWPKPRHFEFSHINLIDGVNGTGKTSLLEAIEVFFCGETHRHGKDAAKNDVTARFIGSPNLVKLPSSPAAQRRRDLSWFGSYWRQKQELAKSFNRYIFFNSDAAFHLEQSNDSQQVVDALMNVALGEDATALWGRMKEYAKEFQEQGTQLRTQVDNLRKERDVARKEISRLEAIPKVAEQSLKVLRVELKKLGWQRIPRDLEEFEADYWPMILDANEGVESFESVAEHAPTAADLAKRIKSLETRNSELRARLKELAKEEDKLEGLRIKNEEVLRDCQKFCVSSRLIND